jgi:hypothetical protein
MPGKGTAQLEQQQQRGALHKRVDEPTVGHPDTEALRRRVARRPRDRMVSHSSSTQALVTL